MLYTVTTESTYYGIVDYIKAEYVMGDYSLYKALEREFVADSERCEHELAVFRFKKEVRAPCDLWRRRSRVSRICLQNFKKKKCK